MKFKRDAFILFILLVSLGAYGPGSWGRANQESSGQDILKPDRLNRDSLFSGFLYFADAGGGSLKALPKQFASNLEAHELGLKILTALMKGPPDSSLIPTFPSDTTVKALFILPGGKAWVDLGLREEGLKNMDTVSELLAIYSVVNSLTLNIPGVKQVKLLVNGSDVATLGGHVSLKYFYKTNMLIVK